MEKPEGKNYKWLLLGLLAFTYFLMHATRQIFNASLPDIKLSLPGTSGAQWGFTRTAFLFAYGLAVPLAGIAADMLRRKWVVSEFGILPPKHKKVIVSLCYATSVALATGWRGRKSNVKMLISAMILSATAAVAGAIDWDNALVMGKTADGRLFYKSGETITMNLWLEGVDAALPDGMYFVDWERRGDDGKTEKGRAPLPFPEGGLVLKTVMESPGFVCFEANVVTADGKRVPKNHRWEKRVFFQGGAGVSVECLKPGKEPADYDEFWRSVDEELAKVPIEAEMTLWPCPDKGVRLYAVRIACAGPRPVTGWLTMPADASPAKRYPILAASRGASHDNHHAPKKGPHDRIRMEINVNGFDLGRDDAYVKEFFKSIGVKGYGYGFDPETNKSRETSYWKGAAMRAARYLEWLATLKEWDGKTLDAEAGSQGGWMMIMGASRCHKVTSLTTRDTWGCDWTGQEELGRLKSTYRPKCWFSDMAYFDAVFAARRVTCPVKIASAGLGDYVSPPSSLAVLYNSLNVPKSITWCQGHTHGWHPRGMASLTFKENKE